MRPDPAQTLMIAAEEAARAPQSHLALLKLSEVLTHYREVDITRHAARPSTARVYIQTAKALALSLDPIERDEMAGIILSLAKSRWRQAQTQRVYRPPRADVYG